VSKGGKKPTSPKVIALQEQLRRRSGVRPLQERFLIVCEDGKSAPNYFKALKICENLSATSIEVFGSDGNTQPIQVVKAAIERKRAADSKDSGTVPFDQVWCVIDGDYGTKINNARHSAKAHQIKLAVSTPCFEYWVLLHFQDYDSAAEDCDSIIRVLKRKQLPKYQRGDCDFSKIAPQARTASERAERLRRKSEFPDPENQNPCSEIYLLIKAILGAMPPVAATPSVPNATSPPKQQGKAKRRPRKR
jgi:hypothetical protein